MRLTKERKLYIAVFGLGLVALVVDRVFLTPAGASGAPVEPAAESPTAAAPAHPAPAPAPQSGPSFGERLEQHAVWPEGPLQDAFLAPDTWVGPRTAPPAAPEVQSEAPFATRHHASAISSANHASFALVDGKTLRVGDVLDGHTFVRVELTVSSKFGVSKTDKDDR